MQQVEAQTHRTYSAGAHSVLCFSSPPCEIGRYSSSSSSYSFSYFSSLETGSYQAAPSGLVLDG